jgi:AcrR family transcriptional regulator
MFQKGYAATTTRQIAESVGMRQASLYYHFADKEDILLTLLNDALDPLSAMVGRLLCGAAGPEVRLWALCRCHIRFLLAHPHNPGALLLQPELCSERFAGIRARHASLQAAYHSLIAQTSPGHALTADELTIRAELAFSLVAGTVRPGRNGAELDVDALAALGADAVVVLAGLPSAVLPRVRGAAADLLTEVDNLPGGPHGEGAGRGRDQCVARRCPN